MLSSHYVDLTHGGVESHVFYLGRELVRLGHEVLVVRSGGGRGAHPAPGPPAFVHVAVDPPRVARLAARLPGRFAGEFAGRLLSNLRTSAALEVVDGFGPDVVHHHDFIENYVLARRAARRRAALIWTNHLGEPLMLERTGPGRLVLRRLAAAFDGALAPSRELLAATHAKGPSEYCPNGVDLEMFSVPTGEERGRAKEAQGFSSTSTVVLVPRRWAPTKGIHLLVAALADLDVPDVHVVFVGSETPGYEAYAAEVLAGLRGWKLDFRILPSATPEEMPDLYRLADIAVFPSVLEATSLGVLEAMASGCLVLGTDVGGIPEVVDDGLTGFLCAPNDPAALRTLLLDALTLGQEARSGIAARARQQVVDRYGWPAIAQRVVALYERVLTARAAQ